MCIIRGYSQTLTKDLLTKKLFAPCSELLKKGEKMERKNSIGKRFSLTTAEG
jgi:hypothetical protein